MKSHNRRKTFQKCFVLETSPMEAFLDTLLDATGLNADVLDSVDDAHRDDDTRCAPVS